MATAAYRPFTHGEELFLAAGAQGVGIELDQLGHGFGQHLADDVDRLVGRAVRTAHRLGDDVVDHLELLRSAAVIFMASAASRVGVVAPQDRGAAFR